MALLDQALEADVATFRQKVRAAMCQFAVTVQGEAPLTMIGADIAAAGTSLTLASATGFAVNDIIQYGSGAAAESRKITTLAGAVATISGATAAHKAGEPLIKLVPNSVNRRTLAKAALNNPDAYAILFAHAICGNDPTLTIQNDPTITDTSIANGVAAVWSAVAGTI